MATKMPGMWNFLLRLPEDWREEIEASASRHERTMTGEIRAMVRAALDAGDSWQTGTFPAPSPSPRRRARKPTSTPTPDPPPQQSTPGPDPPTGPPDG